jgi:hypothetical protein
MCALLVMTAGLSVVFGGYAVSLGAVRDSEAYTRAAFFAEQKLAELRAKELVPGSETTGGFPDRDDYRWNLAYQETTVPSLYLAQIEIFWYENQGKKRRSITVETLQYYSLE